MARRKENPIRATVAMNIGLSDSLLALVNNYVKTLRFALFWMKENVKNPEEKGTLSKVHEGLYEKLKEDYNLIRNVNKLPAEFRDKLYLMQYRRIQY